MEDTETKIILAGDFNINILDMNWFSKNEKKLLKEITERGSIRSINDWSFQHWGTENKSLVDFFIFFNFQNEIRIQEESNSWPMSDHKMIKAEIDCKILKDKNKKILDIPNNLLPSKLKQFVKEGESKDMFQLWKILNCNKKMAIIWKFKSKTKPESLLKALEVLWETEDPKKMVDFYLNEFKYNIGDFSKLRGTDSKKAFNLLAKCTKYKFFAGKREGGLLKKIKFEGEILTDDKMAEKVIEHYQEVH